MPNKKEVPSTITPSSNNVTYVFSHTTLLEALEEWQQQQIKKFPHQEQRIKITGVAMQYFLRSQQVLDHKMIISGNPEDFVIEMPDLEMPEDK
jgi:hypothetical protein